MLRMRIACNNLAYFHPIVPFPVCNFSFFVLLCFVFFFSFFPVYTRVSRLSSLFITIVMFLPPSTDSVFLIHCLFSSYLFAFSYCSWGSQGKNTEAVCHSLLQWTTFCQNSPPWSVHLGWPYMAWPSVSLSWTRLWSM